MTDSPLWRHGDFLKLWSGQTVSLLGSRVTFVALPLVAVITLRASPLQMGLLGAAGTMPYLLAGPAAGVWVDRLPRRPLMVLADLARAVLLASLPLAAWTGTLSMGQLYVVALLSGALSILFDVAFSAYLPALVGTESLMGANSALQIGESSAQVLGPSAAGVLVQALSAPVAILADAASFLLSALSVRLITLSERPVTPEAVDGGFGRDLRQGFELVLRTPLLRALAGSAGLFNLFDSMLFAVYVLYMSRSVGLGAGAIGLVFGLGGIGGLAGALAAGPLSRRLPGGRALALAIGAAAAGELCIALARGPMAAALIVLVAAETVVELGAAVFGITGASLRAAAVPERLQGRVGATVRVVATGAAPAGSVLGGVLASAVGLRGVVLIAAAGTLLSLGPVLDPRVRRP